MLPKPAQVVTRVAAIIVVGGLTLGVCLAALIPGARQIALAHHYTSTVRSLGELSALKNRKPFFDNYRATEVACETGPSFASG